MEWLQSKEAGIYRVHAARSAYKAGHVLVPLASLSLAVRPSVIDAGEHVQLLNDFQLYSKYEGTLDDLLRILDTERGDDAHCARISITWQLIGSLAFLSSLGKGQPGTNPSTLLIHQSGVLLVRVREILQEMNPFPLDIVATLAYMPPEDLKSWLKARFPLDYSSQIDPWISGCVIYRVWCGSLPYDVSEFDTSRDRDTVARVWSRSLSPNWRLAAALVSPR
ncbi:rhoptry protein rop17 [Cystoisospora suis]|uniref:Rhoptry protein rop17 n=1 Tax=Cystoisospora suis TaxID=483139 RepID=A0A2C6KB44_9APIC|nr:rhoptry protein rop17 [Cystoisospora suis]